MKLTKSQAREIRALKRMKEEDIDLTDIPEMRNPAKMIVGKFCHPIKKSANERPWYGISSWEHAEWTDLIKENSPQT